ncbi:MAG: 5-carboxymethyl-2-hydroxymuconate Delta-isomerase [Burkholderiaceae bacterium]
MPHLTLEYTSNLADFNATQALLQLNETLIASGQFEEIDIKSRAIQIETFRVGTSSVERAFAHAKLAILSGRSSDVKRELSESLLLVLKHMCVWPENINVQLCVEIQEIERASYSKLSFGS